MDIYSILSSKPHNVHYLNRYIKFILACQLKNIGFEGYTEKHHICPKAEDMFPEYTEFNKEHSWNKAILTARQHFIAHIMLWKIFPSINSQMFALNSMKNKNKQKINARLYEQLKIDYSNAQSENMKEMMSLGIHPFTQKDFQKNVQLKRVEEGTHLFQSSEFHKFHNNQRIENGTHNFLGSDSNNKRIENGTHNWLGKNNPSHERVANGTHHWLSGELQRKIQNKRVEEGTHQFLSQNRDIESLSKKTIEHNLKRVEEGTHQWLNTVCCVDLNGDTFLVSCEEYSSNTELYSSNSCEGRTRMGKDKIKLKERSVDHKSKISENAKNRYKDPTKNPSYGTICITNGLVNKRIKPLDIIPDGWEKGLTRLNK